MGSKVGTEARGRRSNINNGEIGKEGMGCIRTPNDRISNTLISGREWHCHKLHLQKPSSEETSAVPARLQVGGGTKD